MKSRNAVLPYWELSGPYALTPSVVNILRDFTLDLR